MALEIATYLASVLDKVTPFCDLERQQIGMFNKNDKPRHAYSCLGITCPIAVTKNLQVPSKIIVKSGLNF
jgi:hypothetical protein